jgi:hypothetical protein
LWYIFGKGRGAYIFLCYLILGGGGEIGGKSKGPVEAPKNNDSESLGVYQVGP